MAIMMICDSVTIPDDHPALQMEKADDRTHKVLRRGGIQRQGCEEDERMRGGV